ncbi:MAG TPA: hypothetical protein VF885_10495 [Arthrobacter sp.]
MTIQTPQGPQLTIGQLIAALDELPGTIPICMAGVGISNVPFELLRHRAHPADVVIRARYERHSFMTVEIFKLMLAQHTSQEPTVPCPYPATMDSPLWATAHHELEFRAVTGIDVIKDTAYLRWADVAPAQGPGLQRITDEEVLRRNAELAGRTDANLDPSFGGNRWLLDNIPTERDRGRVRLTEVRLQVERLTREAAELEAAAARYDYTLGLTDVNPGLPEWARS